MPASPPPASPARIFVGRDEELTTLATRLDDALSGHGSLVTLVGEPGIGKTRTVEELLARAALPADRVLWGRCPEHEGAPAYWPWVQALRGYIERADAAALRTALGPAAADLARIVPALRERLPDVVASAGGDHEQARFQLFDGVATFFRRISEHAPLVLVLDDLHWADEASMMLLGFVAPEIRRSRLLIVGTYRELEMRRMARGLGEIARVGHRVTLTGFGHDEVDDFLRQAAAITPRTSLVAELLRVTEGNPFFLDEMVRMLRLEGSLDEEHLDAATKLPDEVREVIRRHLRPLSEDDRTLLAIAAVLGREFDLATLQLACALPADRVLERLERAHAAGLVNEIPDSVGRYRFVHVLIRETLYGDLTAMRRAELHRRAALALEALHRDAHEPPLAELARHFFHAAAVGEADNAVAYARRAGMQALTLLGYEDAVRHFERALEALALRPADDDERLRLHLSLGDAAWRAGDLEKANETLERALRSARALGAAHMFARAALGIGRLNAETGTPDQTLIAFLREALRGLGDGDDPLAAAVMARLAMALYFTRAEEERAELSERAVAMARRLGDPTAIVIALINRHFMLWGPGDVEARLAISAEGLELAGHLADPQLGFEMQRWRLLDLLENGDITAMDRELDVYSRRAEDVRLPTYRWHARLTRTMRVLLAGHFAEGGHLAATLMAVKADGYASPRGQCYMIQSFVVTREYRRLAELDAPFKALARHYPAMPIWRCGLAVVRAEQGLDAWARTLIAPLAAEDFASLPRDGNYIPALTLLAELAHHLGETRWAELLLPLLAPFAARVVMVGPSAACYGSAARYLGLLAETLGRHAEAERYYDDALAMNTGIAARPYVAYTRYDLARLLFARGDGARAAALLDAASKTADELDMPRLRLLAQQLGQRHGGRAEAPLATRVAAGLRRDGEDWVVAYGSDSFRLKDVKGFGYLATLLRHPGQEMHALDLGGATAAPGSKGPGGREIAEEGLVAGDLGDAGEVLDAEARAAYKERLVALNDELEEATSFGDEGRAARAEAEIEVLTKELSRAVGLGGRSRRAGSAAERARLNVTRSISSAIKKIAAESPALGEHLAAAVRTGLFCVYSPDPRLPITWDLGR
ncbi:MAG: AAA family ATPase [Candidatus Binatia bacterium]